MERTYRIYSITAPDGRCYIGCTSQSLKDRWRQHRHRAKTGYDHPFYNLIREIGPNAFQIEQLETADNEKAGQELEVKYIARVPESLRLNLSRGGRYDEIDGSRMFWKKLSPEEKEAFCQKLSEGKKARDWTDYEMLMKRMLKWRKDHPKEAYKTSQRAIRIANRTCPSKQRVKETLPETPEERLHRLRWRFKNKEERARIASENWAGYTEEKQAEICSKISSSRKKYMTGLTLEKRQQMTVEARKHIDRAKQGLAASKGIKKFWAELRKDPERYHEYMSRRSAACSRTMREKNRANL